MWSFLMITISLINLCYYPWKHIIGRKNKTLKRLKRGGTAVFVNNTVKSERLTVKEQICTPDVELLVMSFCPWETSHALITFTSSAHFLPGSQICTCSMHSWQSRSFQTSNFLSACWKIGVWFCFFYPFFALFSNLDWNTVLFGNKYMILLSSRPFNQTW